LDVDDCDEVTPVVTGCELKDVVLGLGRTEEMLCPVLLVVVGGVEDWVLPVED
jgi:hypothetical protein